MTFVRTQVRARTHRLISTRHPTVGVFDDIATDEAELRVAFQLEGLTNIRSQARLAAIPADGLVSGPTASVVMASFLHCSAEGGRFSDGRLGAWYAALDLATAIEETVYHHERRLRQSAAGFPARIQMRELIVDLDAELLDLKAHQTDHPELYDPNDYAASQSFAAARRWPAADPPEDGFVFDSVRKPGGENVCIFRPAAVPLPVRDGDFHEYIWDASGALTVLKLTHVVR